MELYKYFSATGALRLLETGSLRFTQPAEFNDPFEMRPYISGLAPRDKVEQQFDSRLNSEAGDQLLARALDDADLTPDQRASISVQQLRDAIIKHPRGHYATPWHYCPRYKCR